MCSIRCCKSVAWACASRACVCHCRCWSFKVCKSLVVTASLVFNALTVAACWVLDAVAAATAALAFSIVACASAISWTNFLPWCCNSVNLALRSACAVSACCAAASWRCAWRKVSAWAVCWLVIVVNFAVNACACWEAVCQAAWATFSFFVKAVRSACFAFNVSTSVCSWTFKCRASWLRASGDAWRPCLTWPPVNEPPGFKMSPAVVTIR